MRLRFAAAAAFLLIASAAAAQPRQFLIRKFRHPARAVTSAATNAVRRRAVVPPRPSPCADTHLADNADISWMVLDGDTIFYADRQGGLMKIPKSGGTPLLLAANPGIEVVTMTIDAESLYFVVADDESTGSIYSVPRSGGTPKLLATHLPAPIDIKVDATSIYWVNLGTFSGNDVAADGSIERMLKDGSGRQKIVENLSAPAALDVDGSDVYFVESGIAVGSTTAGLRRVAHAGGAITKLDDNVALFAVTLSGSDVYYSGVTMMGEAGVWRLSKSGGTPVEIFSGAIALAIVVQEPQVYALIFDDLSNTSIVTMTRDGSGYRLIRGAEFDTGTFAVDDCAVYFAADLALQRTPR